MAQTIHQAPWLNDPILVGFAGFIIALVGAVLVSRWLVASQGLAAPWQGGTFADFRDKLIAGLTPYGAYAIILGGGLVAIFVLLVPLGLLLRLESVTAVDPLVYDWIARGQISWFRDAMSIVTQIGDSATLHWLGPLTAVLLATFYRGERLLPLISVGSLLLGESVVRKALRVVVPREILPDMAQFPSGGVARVVSLYGLIVFLILRRSPHARQPFIVAGYTTVVVLAYMEGFSRVYLGKHWLTDVLAGYLYGIMLLGVVVAATIPLLDPSRSRSVAARSEQPASVNAARTHQVPS